MKNQFEYLLFTAVSGISLPSQVLQFGNFHFWRNHFKGKQTADLEEPS